MPPENENEMSPGAAVLLMLPPHCERTGALASAIPDGKASVKPTSVNGTTVDGFEMVNVKVDVPPTVI